MSDNQSNALEELLGPKLVTNKGDEIEVTSLVKSKSIILLYFSAHWCPPCRSFTPKLSAAYEEYMKSFGESSGDDADAELIFISSDKDVNAFNEYHKEMTFPALPFDRRDLKAALSKKFHVEGIPTLVAINLQGEVIHKDEDDVDLRSLLMQHGGGAFPFTKDRISQLEREAKTNQAKALKSLVNESEGFDVQMKGESQDKQPLSELLTKNEYVSLLFGDGDFEDAMYGQVAKNFEDTKSILVYVGWSLYNEKSDHTKFVEQFYTLPIPSEDQKKILRFVGGGDLQRVPLIVTLRNGTGLCHMDGTCEELGVPVVVSSDPMMRNVLTFGGSACPWDRAAIETAKKAKQERLEQLKKKIPNFEIFKGENNESVLISKDTKSTAEELSTAVDDGVLGIYFSAHWCPPCKYFTPQLVKCYETLKAAGKKFEIVFVSSDNSKEAFESYFTSMTTETGRQWLALDYEQRDLKNTLSDIYDVEGIPTLVLLRKDGTILTRDGAQRVMKFGPECFPWDDATIEEVQKIAAQREKDVEEEQLKAGGIVLKRLLGVPGAVKHELSDRLLSFGDGFSTIGAPESVTKAGTFYYEIEIEEIGRPVAQFGFALTGSHTATVDVDSGVGVGDDDKSWAVDGFRKQRWHEEESQPFDCNWDSGDVIGLAVDIESGKIAISKNGSWSKNDGCGVVFQSDSISKNGVFPSFSASTANKLRYNMKEGHLKHSAPPAAVWQEDA